MSDSFSYLGSALLFESGAEESSFYSRPGIESLPQLRRVAQDGIVDSPEGIYRVR